MAKVKAGDPVKNLGTNRIRKDAKMVAVSISIAPCAVSTTPSSVSLRSTATSVSRRRRCQHQPRAYSRSPRPEVWRPDLHARECDLPPGLANPAACPDVAVTPGAPGRGRGSEPGSRAVVRRAGSRAGESTSGPPRPAAARRTPGRQGWQPDKRAAARLHACSAQGRARREERPRGRRRRQPPPRPAPDCRPGAGRA